jgi:hypothetical protein
MRLPVGQAALILSLPIMLIGFGQTAVTLQETLIWHRSAQIVFSVFWLLYVLLGPAFFFLPMFPLRRLMYLSKHAYLLKLEEIYPSFDSTKHVWTAGDAVTLSRFADQFAVVQLIDDVKRDAQVRADQRLPIVSPKGVDSRARHRTREHEVRTAKISGVNGLDQQRPSTLR